MNRKICELIAILINSPKQYYKLDDLAQLLSLSTRSIRNYLSRISSFLSEQKMSHLIKITNKGIAFIGDSGDGKLLTSLLIDTNFYSYKLSSEERIDIIALKLMLSKKGCTISSLVKQFNVSRVTIIKDMDQVRFLICRNNMALDSSTSHGYLLMASEKDRRELIAKIAFHSFDNYPFYANMINIYEFYIDKEYYKDTIYDDYEEIIKKAEDEYNIRVSDVYFEKVLFTLKLMTYRMLRGCTITMESAETQSVKRLSVYQIAGYILTAIKNKHGIKYPESEMAYLANKLYEYHFYQHRFIEDNRSIQKHIVIYNFLEKVGTELRIPLFNDSQLIEQLGKHLCDMKKVHNSGAIIHNDFRVQIIKEYNIYYKIISKYKGIMENHFGYAFSEDEIAFIILYIVVAIERHFEDDTVPKVVVVCHTGIGTANFLVEELKANFKIKVLTSTSSHKLEDVLRQYDYDLIISTINLPDTVDNWIKVNPMLEDNDIINLQRAFFKMKKDKRRNILTRMQHKNENERSPALSIQGLEQILSTDKIILEVDCKDWQEAIRSAANILLDKGSITHEYIQAIEDSVVENGAYFVFCPGVALAHAGPLNGVVRFDISMIRLRTPVCFGHKENDPVRYVICFSSTNDPEDGNLILKLMNIISTAELLEKLDTVTDKSDFYRNIIEYGGAIV